MGYLGPFQRALAVLAGGLAIALSCAAPARAQDGYGPSRDSSRRRAQSLREQLQAEDAALNQELIGRRSLDFSLFLFAAHLDGSPDAHSGLGVDYEDVFKYGRGFQLEARHHRPLNRWLSPGFLAAFQYVTHPGDRWASPNGGGLQSSRFDLTRLMAGGSLRLESGSPLTRTRASLSLSAMAGLGYAESVSAVWGSPAGMGSYGVELFDDSLVFALELQARALLSFRAGYFARWGFAVWAGWHVSTPPSSGSRSNAPGWSPADPDPLVAFTIGGGITIEILWGKGSAERARDALR